MSYRQGVKRLRRHNQQIVVYESQIADIEDEIFPCLSLMKRHQFTCSVCSMKGSDLRFARVHLKSPNHTIRRAMLTSSTQKQGIKPSMIKQLVARQLSTSYTTTSIGTNDQVAVKAIQKASTNTGAPLDMTKAKELLYNSQSTKKRDLPKWFITLNRQRSSEKFKRIALNDIKHNTGRPQPSHSQLVKTIKIITVLAIAKENLGEHQPNYSNARTISCEFGLVLFCYVIQQLDITLKQIESQLSCLRTVFLSLGFGHGEVKGIFECFTLDSNCTRTQHHMPLPSFVIRLLHKKMIAKGYLQHALALQLQYQFCMRCSELRYLSKDTIRKST